MKKTKIGLLNLNFIDNYGANLIAFAMEKIINKISPHTDVETINFTPNEFIIYKESCRFKNRKSQFGLKEALRFSTKYIFRKVYWKIRNSTILSPIKKCFSKKRTTVKSNHSETKNISKRLNSFDVFRSHFLTLSDNIQYQEFDNHGYTHIIVGSDVVWKPQRLLSDYVSSAYFLKTAGNYKRIAYAASLGLSDPNQLKRLSRIYKKSIENFDAISIREASTTKYIQNLLPSKKIYNCIDPVFLCSQEEYNTLIDASDVEQPYIYAYIIANNSDAINYVNRLAESKKLKIYYHTCAQFNNGINTFDDGPAEFLSRIKHASYVVTDSFHGTAFSIIFKKQFYTFTRGVLSIRVHDFLNSIGLQDRLLSIPSSSDDIDNYINYDEVWKNLDKWIDDSIEFLKSSLTHDKS